MTTCIYADDLSYALQKIGLESRQHSPSQQTRVAQGHLSFIELQKGCYLHRANIIENSNTSSSAILPAGCHITVLLAGAVSFRVAQKRYHFSADKGPVAFVNIVNKQDIFTRFMQDGQPVEKVTLSCERSWFLQKMASEQACQQIDKQLFHSQHVYITPLTPLLLQQAKTIANHDDSTPFLAPLLLEQHALALLYNVISQFYHPDSKPNQAHYSHAPVQASEAKLSALLLLLEQDFTLTDIAEQLGVSISTLQRNFKRSFNTTLKQYVKIKRLEKARKALLIEGLTIGEAAYLAKYTHVGNFITAFKKHFDITPMQLIKLHRNTTPEQA
ncbi:helix-turn-helix transcriptional regulator [Pseudoalteromonas sp. MMG013]|uniref:helix-turn-helix transcriptional regulator n=1 Tax=Pseudoalteromonas sp. MMG013 TaxID=2822687 RepID=UPI001B36241D|nr:helix-turn-helix transcriptional regulator [Pseudoalteromonas sp. MMG013]